MSLFHLLKYRRTSTGDIVGIHQTFARLPEDIRQVVIQGCNLIFTKWVKDENDYSTLITEYERYYTKILSEWEDPVDNEGIV